jgi:hypothetical protein
MDKSLKDIEKQLEETAQALQAAVQRAAAGQSAGPEGEAPPGPTAEEPGKKKHPGSSRGIETMFRTAYQVQMDLTGLADNKANMMISINGIII